MVFASFHPPQASPGTVEHISICSILHCALREIDKKASSLDLRLKPEKCVPFLFDGKNIDKKSTVLLSHGSTRNISEAPWKVLGHLLAVFPTCSRKASAKKLEGKLFSAIKNIDSRHIRGKFKIWILKNYLMVDLISENSLASIQRKLTKYQEMAQSASMLYTGSRVPS